jgi:hypothetical protein
LTTCLVSDKTDDERQDATKQVLGTRQLQIPRDVIGAVSIVVGHHPTSWWRDGQAAKNYLQRASLQLFGHIHDQRANQVDESVVLATGATHPYRDVEWRPRYSLITLTLEEGGPDSRIMQVTVFPRCWNSALTCFVDDTALGAYPYVRSVRVDPRQFVRQPIPNAVAAEIDSPDIPLSTLVVTSPGPSESRLIYSLVNDLSFGEQLDVFAALGLIEDSDLELSGQQIRVVALRRARDSGRQELLWQLLSARLETKYEAEPR